MKEIKKFKRVLVANRGRLPSVSSGRVMNWGSGRWLSILKRIRIPYFEARRMRHTGLAREDSGGGLSGHR